MGYHFRTSSIPVLPPLLLLLSCNLLLFPILASAGRSSTPYNNSNTAAACGNVSVPYPFGFRDGSYRDEAFLLTCNKSISPPRPFWREYEVLEVSVVRAEIVLALPTSIGCYNSTSGQRSDTIRIVNFSDSPFTYSDRNKFTLTGCATMASLHRSHEDEFLTACASTCSNDTKDDAWSCAGGIGCCQSSITSVGIKEIALSFITFYNKTATWDYNPCSLAFLADPNSFSFHETMIRNPKRWWGMHQNISVILDWSIEKASNSSNNKSLLCPDRNSELVESKNKLGSLCNCSRGYQGNPYVEDGCQDIDECRDSKTYPCYGICINTRGGYDCVCPRGSSGNATLPAGCSKEEKSHVLLAIAIGLCTTFGLLISLAAGAFLYRKSKKIRKKKLRENFYRKNYRLLEQLTASYNGNNQRTSIFSLKEMNKATNRFNDARVVGQGGHGIVYKGMLLDNSVVAIKKSKSSVGEAEMESEIREFINEVAILSQIDHRNVVKLIGCCLETEIPLLVYEFVSNGTLADHIHVWERSSNLSWDDRLRIVTEIASTVAYMHSAASRSVFHRDLKATNVLLDEKLVAKVSDFGTSKSITTDQTHITTAVQGTYGYLDPEYYHTGRFTEKSDVYGFGVILLVVLTGEKPHSQARSEDQRNLTNAFISAMKENRPFLLIEDSIREEAKAEDLQEVTKLVGECLRLRGEERPTMREVEMILRGLKRTHKKSKQFSQVIGLDELVQNELSSEISITSATESTTVPFHTTENSTESGKFLRR